MDSIRLRLALGLVVVALVALVGCGGDDEVDPPEDLQNPVITIDSPLPYDVVQGALEVQVTATDDLGVAKVELFAEGGDTALATSTVAPFGLSVAAETIPDGVARVFARVTDTAGKTADSATIPILLVAVGEEASMTDGFYGDVVVQSTYQPGDEVDVKHHWTMPADVRAVVAIGTWWVTEGGAPWTMEIQVGVGECPHAGTPIGDAVTSSTSPAVQQTERSESAMATGNYFVHLRPVDAGDHVGETVPYEFHVWLLK